MRKVWSVKFPGVGMALIVAGLAQTPVVFAQTYYFNGPVRGYMGGGNGYQEIPFADVSNTSFASHFAGTAEQINFGIVNGAFNYNSSLGTMDFSGNVGLSATSFSSSFDDTRTISGGSVVPATVSLNYSIGNVNNGTLSFDTGVIGHVPNQANVWSLNLQLPVSGTYLFMTGGQTYNGAFDYTLNLNLRLGVVSSGSSSLNFYLDTVPDLENLNVGLAQATADNGLNMNLHAEDPSDTTTYMSWHMENAIAAVPEPGTLSLVSCGLLGLMLSRRRKVRG